MSQTPGAIGTDFSPLTDAQIEEKILDFYVENFENLRLEGGHVLAPEVLDAGLQQVLLYWRKLRGIAEKVTETEVKLTLSDQTTPEGRKFGIEGVVDIVREADEQGQTHTTMYDVKTHDADFVRANRDEYSGQLNVYAFIWQNLRGQDLDETAIISTVLPPALREANKTLNLSDPQSVARWEYELKKWEPVIPIPFDKAGVEATVADFGRVVDSIENHCFAPPPVAVLKERKPGQLRTFATNVCVNCDARFSCDSYRAYALKSGAAANRTFQQYFGETQSDTQRDDWLLAGLDHADRIKIEEID